MHLEKLITTVYSSCNSVQRDVRTLKVSGTHDHRPSVTLLSLNLFRTEYVAQDDLNLMVQFGGGRRRRAKAILRGTSTESASV